jgi:circadian clock protein KaiC
VGISSLADTWLLLRDIEIGGERNRGLYILKSRGMAHSNQIREFLLTDKGVDLIDVYVGPSGVLTGSARISQESQERDIESMHQQEIVRKKLNVETKRKALEAQIASLRAQVQAEEQELKKLTGQEKMRQNGVSKLREKIAGMRKEDENSERRNR